MNLGYLWFNAPFRDAEDIAQARETSRDADWSIAVMTYNTLISSQILPVAMTAESNKPFLPGTNCCDAFPGAKIFYSMYIF